MRCAMCTARCVADAGHQFAGPFHGILLHALPEYALLGTVLPKLSNHGKRHGPYTLIQICQGHTSLCLASQQGKPNSMRLQGLVQRQRQGITANRVERHVKHRNHVSFTTCLLH
jgi:hypothetical protein